MRAYYRAHAPSGILARVLSAPVASPGQGFQPVDPTEAFSLWTPDQGGLRARPWNPQTEGDFALPLATHRPGVRRRGPAPWGFAAPSNPLPLLYTLNMRL